MERSKINWELCRPIIGIENRTPLEVFDIMCSRFHGVVPDLLEALLESREQIAILQERLGIVDPGHGTLSIIDAAVAKATGGSDAA